MTSILQLHFVAAGFAYHNLEENAKAKKCAFIDLLRVQGGLRIIDPMFLKNGITHVTSCILFSCQPVYTLINLWLHET